MNDNSNKKNMTKDKKSPKESSTSGEPTKSFGETIQPVVTEILAKAVEEKVVPFKPLELESALLGTYDLMTRVLLQNDMIATHDTARCIHDNLWLQGDGVDLAIPKRCITDSVRITLQEWIPDKVTDTGFTTEINGVPVRMQFLQNDYDYFKMADVKPFGAEFYKIPNQWEEYWKNRMEIV